MKPETKTIHVKNDDLWISTGYDAEGRDILRHVSVGDVVYLYSCTYVGPSNCWNTYGAKNWHIASPALYPYGLKTTNDGHKDEGWLGTMDDFSSYIYGKWRIIAIGTSNRWEERPVPRYDFEGVKKAKIKLIKVED